MGLSQGLIRIRASAQGPFLQEYRSLDLHGAPFELFGSFDQLFRVSGLGRAACAFAQIMRELPQTLRLVFLRSRHGTRRYKQSVWRYSPKWGSYARCE